MQIIFKKLHPDAVLPRYSTAGDAGLDAVATEYFIDEFGNHVYKTGIATEIPEGYVGLLFPRSSISKHALLMANSVGVVDSGYRGEIIFKFKNTGDQKQIYKVGDRVGQLVILPYPNIEPVFDEINENTDRGVGGFGSTGK